MYYKNGKQDGVQKLWYQLRALQSLSEYKDGVCLETTYWYENGQKLIHNIYENGQLKSRNAWFENSNLSLQRIFDKGVVCFEKLYYKNGQARIEAKLVDGEILLLSAWIEDGIQSVKNGEGIHRDYNDLPFHIDLEEEIKNGKRNGFARYWIETTGQKIEEGYYENNERVGIWKEYSVGKVVEKS